VEGSASVLPIVSGLSIGFPQLILMPLYGDSRGYRRDNTCPRCSRSTFPSSVYRTVFVHLYDYWSVT